MPGDLKIDITEPVCKSKGDRRKFYSCSGTSVEYSRNNGWETSD